MSIRMISEMWDHAPACWSTMDRHIMGVLAESANDDTRECWPGAELLAHRLGIKEESLSRAFRSLRDKGYEVRVALGKDHKGNPIFAYESVRVTYRLPKLCPYEVHDHRKCWPEIQARLEASRRPAETGDKSPDDGPATDDPASRESPDGCPGSGSREPGQWSARARTAVLQSPDGCPGHSFSEPSKEPSSLSRPTVANSERDDQREEGHPSVPHETLTKLGVPASEQPALIARLTVLHHIRTDGWWLTASRNGTLPKAVADARAQTAKSGRAAERCPKHPTRYAHNCAICRTEDQP